MEAFVYAGVVSAVVVLIVFCSMVQQGLAKRRQLALVLAELARRRGYTDLAAIYESHAVGPMRSDREARLRRRLSIEATLASMCGEPIEGVPEEFVEEAHRAAVPPPAAPTSRLSVPVEKPSAPATSAERPVRRVLRRKPAPDPGNP